MVLSLGPVQGAPNPQRRQTQGGCPIFGRTNPIFCDKINMPSDSLGSSPPLYNDTWRRPAQLCDFQLPQERLNFPEFNLSRTIVGEG
jgi:hypothetical protein